MCKSLQPSLLISKQPNINKTEFNIGSNILNILNSYHTTQRNPTNNKPCQKIDIDPKLNENNLYQQKK